MSSHRLRNSKWAMSVSVLVITALIDLSGRPRLHSGPSDPKCSAVSFTSRLDAGKSYVRKVGNLEFRITAAQGNGLCHGWTFSLEDKSGNDFVYPVNMPLRFNPSEMLDCSYGLTARQGLEMKRRMRFILTEQDYLRLVPLMRDALRPGDSPDPDHAAERYLKAIDAVPTGFLRLDTLHFELSSAGLIRSATFRVELIAPSSFHFDPPLKPRSIACSSGP